MMVSKMVRWRQKYDDDDGKMEAKIVMMIMVRWRQKK